MGENYRTCGNFAWSDLEHRAYAIGFHSVFGSYGVCVGNLNHLFNARRWIEMIGKRKASVWAQPRDEAYGLGGRRAGCHVLVSLTEVFSGCGQYAQTFSPRHTLGLVPGVEDMTNWVSDHRNGRVVAGASCVDNGAIDNLERLFFRVRSQTTGQRG